MKSKLILAALAAITILTSASAQTVFHLPTPVSAGLAKAYPDIKAVKWYKEGTNYEASFNQGYTHFSVVFDAQGQILEVEKGIKNTDFPAAVQAALKGKKVKEAAVITRGGKTFYEAEVGGKDLLFDADGKAVH